LVKRRNVAAGYGRRLRPTAGWQPVAVRMASGFWLSAAACGGAFRSRPKPWCHPDGALRRCRSS